MNSGTNDEPKPGRGANLKGIARGRKTRRKAGERLTEDDVERLSKPGYHNDGNGLYLSISAKGAKTWVFRYRWEGRLREMGLGPYGHTKSQKTLEAARRERDEWRDVYKGGDNPIEARRQRSLSQAAEEAAKVAQVADQARRAQTTFGVFAEQTIESLKGQWRNAKHRDQWRNTLTTHAKALWNMPIDAITTQDVVQVLSPIWTSKAVTAGRVRGRIEKILDAAKALDLRQGENPARWRGHLDNLLSKPSKLERGPSLGNALQRGLGLCEGLA